MAVLLCFDLKQKQSRQSDGTFSYLEIFPAQLPFKFKGDFYIPLLNASTAGVVSIMAFHFIDTCRQSLRWLQLGGNSEDTRPCFSTEMYFIFVINPLNAHKMSFRVLKWKVSSSICSCYLSSQRIYNNIHRRTAFFNADFTGRCSQRLKKWKIFCFILKLSHLSVTRLIQKNTSPADILM